MTVARDVAGADHSLKERHRAMWALGDYPTVAAELIPALGRALVEECGLAPGARVLDVAAGSGNVAMQAARAGASVVACDLTPELMEAGAEQARRFGLSVEWQEADAEALPFEDDSFDAVLSCVGVMFAPRHQMCADELLRVCRPGGTVGLISWTPEGFIGQMLATMKPYVPPPPPEAKPPPLWGSESHLVELFGDRVEGVLNKRSFVTIDQFESPEAFREYFKALYGPTVAAYRGIADDHEKVASLDRDLAELARRHDRGSASTVMEWEYLLTIAHKRAF